MANPLVLRFDVKDDGSIALKKIRGDVKGLGRDLNTTTSQSREHSSALTSLKGTVLGLSSAYGALSIVKKVISDGFRYNKTIEEQVIGIRSLIVATSQNVTAQGQALTLQQKYTLANKEALSVMSDLEEINKMTPHTLGQTAQIYKSLFATSKAAGASQKEMVQMTKLVSIAAGNAGIEFNQLLASVDGLANGTFLANSEMGRFMISLGLSKDRLSSLSKEGKSIDYILNRLSDFDVKVNTMNVALSNMDNAWQQLTGELTKNVFESTKDDIADVTSLLVKMKQALHENRVALERVQDVRRLANLEDAKLALKLLDDQLKGLKESNDLSDRASRFLKGDVQVKADINNLEATRLSLLRKITNLEAKQGSPAVAGGTGQTLVAKPVEAVQDTKAEDNIKKQQEYIALLQYENQLRAENVGGVEYLLELRQRGLEAESAIGQQLIEQLATKDQLGGTEDAIAQMEALKEAYTQLRLSTYNEEDLVAQFEAEAMVVEEAFANKLIAEEERKAILEDLTKQHEEKLTSIMSKEAQKRARFEKMTGLQKTQTMLGQLEAATSGAAAHNKKSSST